ncbi:chromate transporter [Pigmentiphaga litoralis]|uniref:chromate transporter n=1 Tax=Pigmentiphaga litoralis TaxID=516702 RepID=UPI003B42BAE3
MLAPTLPAAPPSPAADVTVTPTVMDLFLGFLGLGMIGFGGVLPLAHRLVVEKKRWLNEAEFTDLLGLCQFLPGGNILNLAVAIGMRFHGPRGAMASLFAIIAAPSAVVIALGSIYTRFNGPHLQHMFAGLAAAAAGLLISTALKIAVPIRRKPIAIVIACLFFIAIAVLRLPLLPTMAVLVPLSLAVTWRAAK